MLSGVTGELCLQCTLKLKLKQRSIKDLCNQSTIIFGKKGTFLSNITKGSVRLPGADFFWIIPF